MARLAIAKGFLAEYAKLEKSVQSSVEAAIGKFAEHTYAGMHLEKLHHSRDDRIRTIRVDSFWRGVVLAPETGETYCLITVLPHDKANAYASSHRFSVNQMLGVLEVRDEEALQQLQPSLQAVAQTDDKRLFADVSDADLRQLGVDAQILPLVRLLSTDAHLEALQTMLPDAQYAALYSLACGMTVQEAWARSRNCSRLRLRLTWWTLTTLCQPWNAPRARLPSYPARRSCSGSSLTRSLPGGRSCIQASARSHTKWPFQVQPR